MAVFISMWFLGFFLPFKSEPQRVYWSQWLVINLHMYMELLRIVLFLQQEKVAKTSCMSACKHVATSLMNFLMDNNIKQVTMGALQQFNLDLIQCERKSYCLQNLLAKTSLEIHVWSLGIPEIMWKYDKYTCTMIIR